MVPMPATERPLLVPEAADFLGMSTRALRERVRLRQIPHRRPPYGRKVLLYVDELRQWLDGCELEVTELPGNGRAVKPKAPTS